MKPLLLALLTAGGLVAWTACGAQGFAPARTVAGLEGAPSPLLQGEVLLSPRQLAQLVAARNPEIRYSRLGVDVAVHLSEAEASLYQPVLFANAQGNDINRQRTVEERIASAATLAMLDERSRTLEGGLRQRLPSAGELTLSYRSIRRANNIIATSTGNQQDTEWTTGMVLSLKQPLLRNAGRGVLETDRQVAQLEREVQWAQFRQQVLKSTADALNLYWQLQRAQQARRLRDESLVNVRKMAQDVEARIEAGRTPPVGRLEVQTTLVARQAELTRSEQAEREALARVMTALNLSAAAVPGMQLRATDATLPPDPGAEPPEQLLERALTQWPPYQMSQLRLQQGRLRLEFARSQRKPQLDFVVSYSGNGLAYGRVEANRIAANGRYPEWGVGLSFEMPLGGGKGDGQYAAQAVRVQQGELELEAIRTSLANDLAQRRDDLRAALRQVAQMQEDLALRSQLEDAERERYRLGMGLLSQWLLRENETFEARQRLAEAQMRAQMARVAWQFAQGSLLDEYDIALRSE